MPDYRVHRLSIALNDRQGEAPGAGDLYPGARPFPDAATASVLLQPRGFRCSGPIAAGPGQNPLRLGLRGVLNEPARNGLVCWGSFV